MAKLNSPASSAPGAGSQYELSGSPCYAGGFVMQIVKVKGRAFVMARRLSLPQDGEGLGVQEISMEWTGNLPAAATESTSVEYELVGSPLFTGGCLTQLVKLKGGRLFVTSTRLTLPQNEGDLVFQELDLQWTANPPSVEAFVPSLLQQKMGQLGPDE